MLKQALAIAVLLCTATPAIEPWEPTDFIR